MPMKKGPYGTKREYNPSNGRYSKKAYGLTLEDYKKYQKKIKETFNTECLRNRARKSTDKYLFETFEILERFKHNYVVGVHKTVTFKSDNSPHELDIICKDAIIEVKSGRKPGCLTQCLKQKEYATIRHKKHILFAPDLSFNARRVYESFGLNVATNENELIKEIKK